MDYEVALLGPLRRKLPVTFLKCYEIEMLGIHPRLEGVPVGGRKTTDIPTKTKKTLSLMVLGSGYISALRYLASR